VGGKNLGDAAISRRIFTAGAANEERKISSFGG